MATKAIELPTAATSEKASGAGGAAAVFFIPKSVITELYTSGISVGTANTVTNPLDVIKVRLQLARNQLAAGVKPPGMIATGINVVRTEGVGALWSGLGPSLARGFFFGGARLGLYTPIKTVICGENSKPSLEMKVLSGSLSGGLAAAVTSPIELIKTRLQAAGRDPTVPKTSVGVIRAVVAADGVAGLWKGAMPGLIRSAILTAAQCATYDEVKRTVTATTGWTDGVELHLTSSMIAGLVTTTITNPIDVIKTRMFVGGKSYSGPMACAAHVLKSDGLIGFMKGWSASYARLGPHTVIMFLTAERLRKYAGLQSL
ncbi:hypothetical protein CHLRE_15g641200v5 [Chlamydomonas reinhardtii]|uniref:Mitochondrial substrate carrier protein n=1 Tax=Chlamydomonas reinhardtii TaxID=3055 RepID=A8JHJ5_CHLRE|nr:uncharacterized protein CHLRE_15g641200v5 [Chlamydomonas reinhardtii]PNW72754.1 hypothetical protein CHLRE_15g641200v5 [Chlamydomonas reinhardtii]|eukprot:XP_001703074.1 predicted protein [Chlamydomonas reinhardtii]